MQEIKIGVRKPLPIKEKERSTRKVKRIGTLSIIGVVIGIAVIAVSAYMISNYFNSHVWKWQSPIVFRTPLVIEKRESKTIIVPEAQAESIVIEPISEKDMLKKAICDRFTKDCKTMLAIAQVESGYNVRAINWNCKYQVGMVQVSKQCKPEDRGKAWSVDCGLLQSNVYGQKCPEAMFDPESNIEAVYAKYERRGLGIFSSYTNKSYMPYLSK